MITDNIAKHNSSISKSMQNIFSDREASIYRIMEYQVGLRDELGESTFGIENNRIWKLGILALLISESASNSLEFDVSNSVSLELLKLFTEVHIDIGEGVQYRNNRPTLWALHGPAQAINVGDGLHAMARLALVNSTSASSKENLYERLKFLENSSLLLCEGIHEDLSSLEKIDFFVNDYFIMVQKKIASLFECAFQLALCGTDILRQHATIITSLAQNIAYASQITSDINSIWPASNTLDHNSLDLLNKKKTFPIVMAFSESDVSQKRELANLFYQRVISEEDVEKITDLLTSLDIKNKSQKYINEYFDLIIDGFSQLGLSLSVESDLLAFIKYICLDPQ
jgi:geranylgeranyl diphosphate synthase type I|tara:strand:+ start:2770 stop:3792 length:1023 start_codon:yes stop_codon:yes gene_type:complete